MRRLMVAGLIALVIGGPFIVFAPRAQTVAEEFSNADIRGPYGFSFDGFVTLTLPNGSPISVPVSAVGQLTLDGAGEATGTRTLNLGGFVVLEQESSGTYAVQPNGTVTSAFEVRTVKAMGSPPPGVDLPATTLETFSAVINQPLEEIQFIATGILNPETQAPLAAVTARGVARRQGVSD